MRTRRAVGLLSVVAAVVCIPFVAQGDAALSATAPQRKVEVRDKKSKQVVETWQRSANKDGSANRVSASGARGFTATTTHAGKKSATISYRGGGRDGTIVIKGGKIVRNTVKDSPQIIDDARRARARLVSYEGSGAKGSFDFKVTEVNPPPGGPGTAQIDWDCEKATIDVIIWCGLLNVSKCGDAVSHQQCECLPEDPPGGCD